MMQNHMQFAIDVNTIAALLRQYYRLSITTQSSSGCYLGANAFRASNLNYHASMLLAVKFFTTHAQFSINYSFQKCLHQNPTTIKIYIGNDLYFVIISSRG